MEMGNNENKSREKIDKLNIIIEELLGDARELAEDLTAGIRLYWQFGVLSLVLLFVLRLTFFTYMRSNIPFMAFHLLVLTPIYLYGGISAINKHSSLKKKYISLYTILND